MPASSNPLAALLNFLEDLDRRQIHYELACHRPRMLMVKVAVPGERWEVEFSEHGQVEFEGFRSTEGVIGRSHWSALTAELDRFSDQTVPEAGS
jgi:hypothetical protein